MDALILSCGTGGGHNAAGFAVKEELLRRGHSVEMINPYTLCRGQLAENVDQSYVKLVQKAPGAFGAVYSIGNAYRRLPFRSPVYYLNGWMKKTVQQYLQDHSFDVVVMPHLFPAEIFTNMKRHGIRVPKTLFIATDYTCIPFTEECDCDAYVIPSPLLADEFAGKGIPREKLYPLGIPVQRAYREAGNPSEAKRLLGLDEEKRYILMSGGSMGSGKIEELVDALHREQRQHPDTELIVVCGSNQPLLERLNEQKRASVHAVGFTKEMALYLRASDLYITKPGGLSSTEAAVVGIPILHYSPIPGCETHNVRFFAENGLSVRLDSASAKDVFAILADETRKTDMKKRQHELIPRNAASDICDLIGKMCS